LQKKHVYFRETLNYILFKIFSIVNYNFFLLFWQVKSTIKKVCLSQHLIIFLFLFMFWNVSQQASIKISDNLKEHCLMNTWRDKTSHWSANNIFLTTFATTFCVIKYCRAKLLCVFFELLLDVSGLKHDSNRLTVIDNS